MWRAVLVAVALVALTFSVRAEEDNRKLVREVLVHGHAFPPNVALLVDASGSMLGQPYKLATHEAMRIAGGATDGARVRFFAFRSLDVLEEPQGWIKLPDLDALRAARDWLSAAEPDAMHGTNLAEAVEHVLALPDAPLGVVVISDGVPTTSGADRTLERIAVANAERESPAVIGVVSIQIEHEEGDRLCRLIAGGRSDFVRIRRQRASR